MGKRITQRAVLTVDETVQQRKAKLLLQSLGANWTDFFLVAGHSGNGIMCGHTRSNWPDTVAAYLAENPQVLRGMMVAIGKACEMTDFRAMGAPADNTIQECDEAELTPEDLGTDNPSPILGPNGELQLPSSFPAPDTDSEDEDASAT